MAARPSAFCLTSASLIHLTFFHLRLVLGQLVIIVELRHALEFSGSTWGQNLMIFWYSLKIVISPSC